MGDINNEHITEDTPSSSDTPTTKEKVTVKIFQVDSSNILMNDEEFETVIKDAEGNTIVASTNDTIEAELTVDNTYTLHQNYQNTKYIIREDVAFTVQKENDKVKIELSAPSNFVKTDGCCIYIIHFLKPELHIHVTKDADYDDKVTLQIVKDADNIDTVIVNEKDCGDCYTVTLNKGTYTIIPSIDNQRYYEPLDEQKIFVNDWGMITYAKSNQPVIANKIAFNFRRKQYTLSIDVYCGSDMIEYPVTIEDLQSINKDTKINVVRSFENITYKASKYAITDDARLEDVYVPFQPITLDLYAFNENHININLEATTNTVVRFRHIFKDLHGYNQVVENCVDEIYEYVDKNSLKLVRQITNGYDCEVLLSKNKTYKYTCQSQPCNYSKPKSQIFKIDNFGRIQVLSDDNEFWNNNPDKLITLKSKELNIVQRPVTFSVVDDANHDKEQINVKLSLYKKVKDIDNGTEEYVKIHEWMSAPEKQTFILDINQSYLFNEEVPEHYESSSSYKIWFNVADTGLQKQDEDTFTRHLELQITNHRRPIVSVISIDNNSNPLNYCHIHLLNKDGSEIDNWYSNNDPHEIELYSNEEYIVYESYSPQGYSVNTPFIINAEAKEVVLKHTYNEIKPGHPEENNPEKPKPDGPSKDDDYNAFIHLNKGPIHVFRTPGFKHHIDDIDTAYTIIEDKPYVDQLTNTLWRKILYKIPGSGRIAVGFVLDMDAKNHKSIVDDTGKDTFIIQYP